MVREGFKMCLKNPEIKVVDTRCNKIFVEYIPMQQVNIEKRIHSDEYELETYMRIRNCEEGHPFLESRLRQIYRKSIYLLKKVDKPSAIGYINSIFRDQVWNKDHGYHDLRQRLIGNVTTKVQPSQTGGSPGGGPSTGGTGY